MTQPARQQNYAPNWVGHKSDTGPTRAANEDAVWVSDETTPTQLGALYVVADGVGGQKFGAIASQLATTTVRTTFYQQRRQGEPIGTALKAAILEANRTIYAEAQRREVSRMGSTVVTAVYDQHHLYLAHVGDARAYLLRQGQLQQLTKDDTWVQQQVDAGLFTAEDAARHELRNVVTQVLGNKLEVNVHLSRSIPLETGDSIMLCSDGLHDVVPDEQIIQILSTHTAAAAAAKLVAAAIAANASDNITAVVLNPGIVIPSAPPPASPRRTRPRRTTPWGLFLLGFLVLLVGAGLVYWLTNGGSINLFVNSPATLSATIRPTAVAPTAATEATLPATRVLLTATTAALLPVTLTSAPATPIPSPTPAVTPIPEGCINTTVFVWSDDQINDTSCTAVITDQDFRLDSGEKVFILDGTQRTVTGPDTDCKSNPFIKVRSETKDNVEGWVLSFAVNRVDAGASCTVP